MTLLQQLRAVVLHLSSSAKLSRSRTDWTFGAALYAVNEPANEQISDAVVVLGLTLERVAVARGSSFAELARELHRDVTLEEGSAIGLLEDALEYARRRVPS